MKLAVRFNGAMTMRVLVTGVNGFTGSYLVKSLNYHGFEVHGFGRRESSFDTPLISHLGDLLDSVRVCEIVHRVKPEYVVHLAGVSFVAHGDAESIYRANLIGTRHLLEALCSLPSAPNCVLLASSANIYGNSTEGVMLEGTPPDPANDYAVSKLGMEYLSRLYVDRLPIVITRPFNYTGVGQSSSFLLPKIVHHAVARMDTIELGNLEVARDFSDVRMIAEAYARLLREPNAIGSCFNVCTGRAYTLREVLEIVEGLSGHRMEVKVSRNLVRSNEVRVLLGSNLRLKSVVGSLPEYDLKNTLKWMIESGLRS